MKMDVCHQSADQCRLDLKASLTEDQSIVEASEFESKLLQQSRTRCQLLIQAFHNEIQIWQDLDNIDTRGCTKLRASRLGIKETMGMAEADRLEHSPDASLGARVLQAGELVNAIEE